MLGPDVQQLTRRLGTTLLVVATILLIALADTNAPADAVPSLGALEMDLIPGAGFEFGGMVGRRVKANVENWLIEAPKNNPGLLDMFARRDSAEKPDLVPWAGEFVGKYLISGVQAMRMSGDPRLHETLQGVVDRLVELQAEDGYLGPWPKEERLLGHWDLWGHYHIILGLLLWYEHTGDESAMNACRRIADLVCETYLDTGRRVHQAGSHEMNMGIIHGLVRLHRKTGQCRYLRMAEEVLEDFELAGDYFRQGLAGKEFFATPRPRWESLHSLQGMVELYQITADRRYRRAFLNHWASIRRFDLRNTGGFSSGEQATGNPFRNDTIETCCVIAWQAVMIDALRLTGDSTIADDLELTTFSAALGSQHPSGAWCTYDTPMNGKRVPSHVAIEFQARPDTPHLNCCAVNGPRGYGTLSEWGVMRKSGCLVVNYYGPMRANVSLADGTPVTLVQQTDYPIGEKITLKIGTPESKQFPLALRIPSWSQRTQVTVGGKRLLHVEPGRYLELARRWEPGDEITLRLDMRLRCEAGDLGQYGRVSLYRGPILLALDARFVDDCRAGEEDDAGALPGGPPAGASEQETRDVQQDRTPAPAEARKRLPPVDVSRLAEAKLVPIDESIVEAAGDYLPWLVVDVPAVSGHVLRLIDFASAGATGGGYISWLPAIAVRPPKPAPWSPADRATIGPGPIRFSWRTPALPARDKRKHRVVISDSPTFDDVVLSCGEAIGTRLVLPVGEADRLKPHVPHWWKLVARNEHGEAESTGPHKQFTIDPAAPPMPSSPYGQREDDQLVTAAPLAGRVEAQYGTLLEATGWKPAPGPAGEPNAAVETEGDTGMIKYKLVAFPEEEYTVSIWVAVTRMPQSKYGQVFSAWCAGGDDPLRLVVEEGKLAARIEAGRAYTTDGVELELGRWYHVVGVKQHDRLLLYLDGKACFSGRAPLLVSSMARDFAVGGNPNYPGAPEFLAARFADLRFYARALPAAEIERLHAAGPGTQPVR